MMLCELFDRHGMKRLLSFEATPECAIDYCDHCGDCLVCDWEDPCDAGTEGDRGHGWVLYAEDLEKFLKTHKLDPALVEKLRAAVRKEEESSDG